MSKKYFRNFTVINPEIKDYEIIDYETKGNVIRFYLGKNGGQWGDDWDDPLDNAGKVYNEHIGSTLDVFIPYDDYVLTPTDCLSSYYNSHLWQNKGMMIERKLPCVLVVPEKLAEDRWDITFDQFVGDDNIQKFYFGDDLKEQVEAGEGWF